MQGQSAMQPTHVGLHARDEQVWVLLLGKAWQPLEQQVVCKLLCVSDSMAQLVHTTCAGRLPVVMEISWASRTNRRVLQPAAFPPAAPINLPPGFAGPPPHLLAAAHRNSSTGMLLPPTAAAFNLPQGFPGVAGAAGPLSGLPLPMPPPAAPASDTQQQQDQHGAVPTGGGQGCVGQAAGAARAPPVGPLNTAAPWAGCKESIMALMKQGLPPTAAFAAAGLRPGQVPGAGPRAAAAAAGTSGMQGGLLPQSAAGQQLLPPQHAATGCLAPSSQLAGSYAKGGALPQSVAGQQLLLPQHAAAAGCMGPSTRPAGPNALGMQGGLLPQGIAGQQLQPPQHAAGCFSGQMPGAAAAAAGTSGAVGMQGAAGQQLLPLATSSSGVSIRPAGPSAGGPYFVEVQEPHVLGTDAPSKWMAKHAVLLSSLRVNQYDTDERRLSEGIQTALAALATGSSRSAEAAADATAADAARAALPAAAAGREAGGLPLQALDLSRSDGSLLCALAGSRQLTRLDLALPISVAASAEVQAAIGSFTALQTLGFLELMQPRRSQHGMNMALFGGLQHQDDAEPPKAFEQVMHVLQPLTRLTRLNYNRMLSKPESLQQLPPSLVALRLANGRWMPGQRSEADAEPFLMPRWDPLPVRQAGLSFSHLTALTHLVVDNLQETDELPGSLVSLIVGSCFSLVPARALLRLQRLKVNDVLAGTDFALLQKLPSLQEVHVKALSPELRYEELSDYDKALIAAAPHFGGIPLKSLHLGSFTIRRRLCDDLGKCSALTKVWFDHVRLTAPLERFGAAVHKMTSLREFAFEKVEFEGSQHRGKDLQEAQFRPFLKGLAALPELRSIRIMECWRIGEAASELAAATKLQFLMLYVCGVEKQTEALLRAKLPHLDEDSLVIEA